MDWLNPRQAHLVTVRNFDDLSLLRRILQAEEGQPRHGTRSPSLRSQSRDKLIEIFTLEPGVRIAVVGTLQDQIESLLPEDSSLLPVELRQYVIEALSRIAFDNNHTLLLSPEGVHPFVRALLTLHHIAQLYNQEIPWFNILNTSQELMPFLSDFRCRSIRPDGPLIDHKHIKTLSLLRANLNILEISELKKICLYMHKAPKPSSLRQKEVLELLNLDKKQVSHWKKALNLIVQERFIVAAANLGLRYRIILKPRRRYFHWNAGLAQRILLSESEFSSVGIYVEPADSSGPSEDLFSEEMVHFTASDEAISLRFDRNKWWEHLEFEKGMAPKQLYLESPKASNPSKDIKGYELHALGILWGLEASGDDRRRFCKAVNVKEIHLETLQDNQRVMPLYQPVLDYAGLSQGSLVAVWNCLTKEIMEIQQNLLNLAPYVNLFKDKAQGNMLAFIRVGTNVAGLNSFLSDWLLTLDVPFNVGKVDEVWTYLLTLPNRIRGEDIWRNPWL